MSEKRENLSRGRENDMYPLSSYSRHGFLDYQYTGYLDWLNQLGVWEQTTYEEDSSGYTGLGYLTNRVVKLRAE